MCLLIVCLFPMMLYKPDEIAPGSYSYLFFPWWNTGTHTPNVVLPVSSFLYSWFQTGEGLLNGEEVGEDPSHVLLVHAPNLFLWSFAVLGVVPPCDWHCTACLLLTHPHPHYQPLPSSHLKRALLNS